MAVKNFCYCIGGTGTRVAEVAGHLCAMNMVGEQDITFIVVDKDANCGGTRKALNLLETVTILSDVAHHPDLAIIRSAGKNKEFCKSSLDVYQWDFSDTMQSLTGAKDGEQSLKDSLTSKTSLQEMESDGVLFDAFYSRKEQQKDTSKGFYGHPSIGALIFNYMVEKGGWNAGVEQTDIAYPIMNHLIQNPADTIKVFIIGSVFGGTGASIFSNLATHIRKSLSEADKGRVFISGSLLLPYFTFVKQDGGLIDTTEFYSKSIVALEQYGADKNLMKTATNPSGSFDSLYVCGQEPLHCTSEIYSEGGASQCNHFNFVDLAAAQAMTQFFSAELVQDANNNGAYKFGANYNTGLYEYRYDSANVKDIPAITLANTPGLDKCLKAMTAFCTYFITKVYTAAKCDSPKNNFMINRLFENGEIAAFNNTYANQFHEIIDRIYGYCCSFVEFMGDIAYNGYDWSNGSYASYENLYNMFNRDYFNRLIQTINLLSAEDKTSAARFINSTFAGGYSEYVVGAQGISVTSIDRGLEAVFDGHGLFRRGESRRYHDEQAPVNVRVGDYIHEAFKFCYENS